MFDFSPLRRRLRALIAPASVPVSAPSPPPRPVGHPDNPLTPNLLARRRFAAALDTLADGPRELELATIRGITSRWPGLAPESGPTCRLAGLRVAAAAFPGDLTLRAALAEAVARSGDHDEARELAISIIRDARPRHGNVAGEAALEPFRAPDLAGTFFHSIDLGSSFIEGDLKTAVITARETLQAHWPDLRGKSVLDIGAFGGWFSFEAERRGAAQVTANDYYSWMIDFRRFWAWASERVPAGVAANPYTAPYPINDPLGQPGRKVFDLTHEALSSSVVPVFGAVETAPLEPHDIVLLLGVLYHSEDPLGLLRRAFELTKETLIIETLSFEYPANLAAPIWHFYGSADVTRDTTTVWAPSSIGLREALLKVGFSRVDMLYGWDGSGYHHDWNTLEARLWVHAHR